MPIVAIICIVLFLPWDLVPAWIAPLPDTVQEQIDDALDYGLDGIIFYANQSGSDPAFYAAGWKNKENLMPTDPHALFKIAGINKLYITTSVAKLVQYGRLSLDETLVDYLPELAGSIEYADQITLRMMVQNHSGIPNYADDDAFDWFAPPADDDKK